MKSYRKSRPSSNSGSVEYHDLELKNVKEEQKRNLLLSKIDAIDKTLKDVRDTRSFKVSQSSLAPDVHLVTAQDPRGDNSYVIDTSTPQLTTCPHCFKQLAVRELRGHLQKACSQKMVQCQERGCSAVLPQNELKEHLKNGCAFAKKRRSLAAVSVKRKEDAQIEILNRIEAHQSKPMLPSSKPQFTFQQLNDEEDSESNICGNEDVVVSFKPKPPPVEEEALVRCDNCDDMIPEGKFKVHAKEECRFRLIYCTNRHMGCMEEVPFCEINQHLRQSCVVEEQKEELVRRSLKRRQEVKCPGCGQRVELQYLRQHENTTCVNRKVPCRNHALGCEVIVRLKDRKTHEDVSSGVKPRPCLFFDGQDTRLLIEEDDITPPWTTELWVYRPSLLESAKCHIREIRRIGQLFRECTLQECLERVSVLELKSSLENVAIQVGDVAKITTQIDQHLILYEKAALNTCMYGQLLLVAVTTAAAEIVELQLTRSIKEVVEITPKVTGKTCLKSYAVKHLDESGSILKQDSEFSESDAADIARRSAEMNEQMKVLKKILEDQEADKGGEELTKKSDEVGREQGEELATEEEGEKGDSSNRQYPEGFESIKTDIDEHNWEPQRWRDWAMIAERVSDTLESDQLVLRSWRLATGLVRMTSEEKSALKNSGKSDSKAELKARKEASRAAKREKREKKKRKGAKEVAGKKSNFSAKFESIQRMYTGSEPLCVGPDACIYLNLSGVSAPGKKKSKSEAADSITKKVQGTFGFADKIEGTHSFNMKVPREKWTHVIVQCTKTPKKRIHVYSNSFLVGTLKDHFFNLPMQSIGSEYLSFHGYLLDARFWAKERSSAEMKHGMHNLLHLSSIEGGDGSIKAQKSKGVVVGRERSGSESSATPEKQQPQPAVDMSGDRLISWWTFEDGFYSKSAQDISGNRFPTDIRGGRLHMNKRRQTHWYEAATLVTLAVQEQIDNQLLVLAGSQVDGEDIKLSPPPPLVLPLPSFIERNLCPFEVKRAKLAQRGRALMKEAKCPLGCKEKIRKVDMRFHVKHECERRKIKCRFKFCGKTYMAMDAAWHETSDDCAAIRSRDEVLRSGEVDRKLFQCDMCSEKIQSRHFNHHTEELCQHRLIRCPHADCHTHLFPAHALQYHLEVKCKSAFVREKKMLITRARGSRSYARPWGVSVRYNPADYPDTDEEDEGGQ